MDENRGPEKRSLSFSFTVVLISFIFILRLPVNGTQVLPLAQGGWSRGEGEECVLGARKALLRRMVHVQVAQTAMRTSIFKSWCGGRLARKGLYLRSE